MLRYGCFMNEAGKFLVLVGALLVIVGTLLWSGVGKKLAGPIARGHQLLEGRFQFPFAHRDLRDPQCGLVTDALVVQAVALGTSGNIK